MKVDISEPTERGFPLRYWVILSAVAAAAAVLVYPHIRGTDESTSRIDRETVAIRWALVEYKKEFGAFPSGDTRSICHELTGKNPKGTRFIDLRLAPDGRFLDPWGTPYEIYFSGDSPLVRSAGPNKQFDPSTTRKRTDDYIGG